MKTKGTNVSPCLLPYKPMIGTIRSSPCPRASAENPRTGHGLRKLPENHAGIVSSLGGFGGEDLHDLRYVLGPLGAMVLGSDSGVQPLPVYLRTRGTY